MGMDLSAVLVAGFPKEQVYKRVKKEREIKKKDKYGKEYTESVFYEVEMIGTKEISEADERLSNFLYDRNVGAFPYSDRDNEEGQIIGYVIAKTGSHRNNEQLEEVELKTVQKGVQKAKEIFNSLGMDPSALKVYLVADVGY